MQSQMGIQYILENNEGVLLIDDQVFFLNQRLNISRIKNLTPAEYAILKCLLDAEGKTVSYNDLYDKCPHKRKNDEVPDKAQTLHRLKSKMDEQIAKHIKTAAVENPASNTSDDKRGYILPIEGKKDVILHTHLTNAVDIASTDKPINAALLLLTGEYYMLYPDSKGNDYLQGGYLHIQNCVGQMVVHAILGVRNNADFKSIPSIFAGESKYFANFDIENFENIDGRNLFTGVLEKNSDYVVAITLDSVIDKDRWQIVLNIKDFMIHPRDDSKEENLYRGGMGLLVGGRTNDISASRIVLIRKSLYLEKYMNLDSSDIKVYLGSKQQVRLTEQSDYEFYQWLIGKHPLIDK